MSKTLNPCKIALIDPTHTGQIIAIDTFPLGMGFIAGYLKKQLGSAIDFRILKYPDDALTALREYEPDVVLLANYIWNSDLSCMIGRYAKELRPSTLVIQGGPDFSLDQETQAQYLASNPQIDLYMVGEGEVAVTQVIEDYLGGDGTISYLKRHSRLPGGVFLDEDGTYVDNKVLPRMATLGEIPSPYLSGYMDPFFDDKLAPMIETNRGCPFTCTFCQQGTSYFTKVRNFGVERVKEEFTYIAKKLRTHAPHVRTLRIADPNFGMYERDLEIAEHIGRIQEEYGWPTFIDATTGKNIPRRVVKAVDLMHGGLRISSAVQSMDADVLKNIKRSNIKLGAYAEIQSDIKQTGLQSMADYILALPGETLVSLLSGYKRLIDSGIQKFNSYQLMMLRSTELEMSSTRQQFGFQTQWRVLPRCFGEYAGRRSLEIEEIVVATSSLSFDDYLVARKWHLVIHIFYNEWLYRELLEYLWSHQISAFDWLEAIMLNMADGPQEVTELFEQFDQETQEELFDSQQQAMAFYTKPENFERLLEGDFGSNLLYKNLVKALLMNFDAATTLAFEQLRHVLQNAHDGGTTIMSEEIEELERFTRERLVLGRVLQGDLAPTQASFKYNFAKWIEDGYTRPLAHYREDGVRLTFATSKRNRGAILDSLSIFGTSLPGLAKMLTRITLTDFKTDVTTATS